MHKLSYINAMKIINRREFLRGVRAVLGAPWGSSFDLAVMSLFVVLAIVASRIDPSRLLGVGVLAVGVFVVYLAGMLISGWNAAQPEEN